jgi:hypothetical protein
MQDHRAKRPALALVAPDQFGSYVLGVCGGSAVPKQHQLAAAAKCIADASGEFENPSNQLVTPAPFHRNTLFELSAHLIDLFTTHHWYEAAIYQDRRAAKTFPGTLKVDFAKSVGAAMSTWQLTKRARASAARP